MLEFRKEYFKDERDDRLNEVGQPTPAPGHAGPRHRPHALLRRPRLRGPAASEGAAQPASACAPARHRRVGGRALARRQARDPRRRRAGQQEHAAEPHQLRQGRRAAAGGRQGALQGRADRGGGGRERGRGLCRARQDPRRLRPAARRVRRGGGDQARRAGGERDLPGQHLRVPREVQPPEAALRRRRARVRLRRLRGRRALPDVAHRARADRDQRLHRRARDQRPLRGAHLHAGAVLLARHRRQAARRALQPAALHRRHGRRRLRRQGRFTHRAARPSSAPC